MAWDQFSTDSGMGSRPLPSGVTPSTAGGGRGSVNPVGPGQADVEPSRAQRIAEMDEAINPENPSYLPLTTNAVSALQVDGRGNMDDRRTRSPGRVLDKDIPAFSAKTAIQDVVAGVAQIIPTVGKGVGDIARMATADRVGKGLSDYAESSMDAARNIVGSDRAAAQRTRYEQDMVDPGMSAADLIAGNPGALADQILPTIGSMALPIGVAGVAGKLATTGKAAQLARAIDEATVLAHANKVREAATIGATVLQNAGDTYGNIRDKGGDQGGAYLGAAITAPATYVAGRLTGGGAEASAAKMLSGSASGAAKAIPGAMLKEGSQEVGEEIGQYVGETVGTGAEFDGSAASKRFAVAATLGAVMGGGVEAAGAAGAARERRIKMLRDSGETATADLMQQKHDTATAAESVDGELQRMPGNPEFQASYRQMRTAGIKPVEAAARSAVATSYQSLVATAGIPEKAAAVALEKAATLPLDQVPGFFAKFTAGLVSRGLGQPFDGMDGMASGLEAARDDAIEAAMGTGYQSANEIQQTMDDVMALENTKSEFGGAQSVADKASSVSQNAGFDAQNSEIVSPAPESRRPEIDEAAHAAATSPLNDHPEPSTAQKKAGNYKVGRLRVAGMDIAVENPEGSVRRGTDADGKPWETPMRHHYGYFNRTTATDGDKLDVFVKPGTPKDFNGSAFVIDQLDTKTGKLDEHKVVLGATNEAEAEAIYRENYDKNWQGMGAITRLPLPAFRAWAKSGDKKSPLGDVSIQQTALREGLADGGRGYAGASGDLGPSRASSAQGDSGVNVPAVSAMAPVVSGNAATRKGPVDGAVGNADGRSNLIQGGAAITQRDSHVNRPSQLTEKVLPDMGGLVGDNKVDGGVVEPVLVPVVDDLGGQQRSSENLLNDKPVLKSLATNTVNFDADQSVGGLVSGKGSDVAAGRRSAQGDAPKTKPNITPGSTYFGHNNTPLDDGGKPFKTKDEASAARKLQPMLRVVPAPGGKGFALAPKTEAQLAAQENAAKRLSIARTGQAGVPTAAHEFIAGEGGMDASTRTEFSFGANPRVGNRTLSAGARGGMSIEAATEKLIEARYLPEGASHSDTVALINRSFTQPQYTVDGTEAMAEAEYATRFEDHLAAEQEAAQAGAIDPFGPLTDHDFLVEVGYEQATPEVQAEFRALISLAESHGTDAESIQMDVAARVGNAATDQEYHDAAITALKAALQGSLGDGRTVSGGQSQETGPAEADPTEQAGLTAPTRADILAQHERADNAPALDNKAQIDAEAQHQTLTRQAAPEQRTDTSGDMFAVEKAQAVIDKRNAGAEKAKDPNQAGMFDEPAQPEAPVKQVEKAAGKTDTPAFKAWFGDSKVVDFNGNPLVMYHGTSKSEKGDAFTSFDTYASNYGLMGMGGYFTADPAVASSYTTKGKGSAPSVYPVYLSIKNPIDMDGKADPATWQAQFRGIEDYHDGGSTNEDWYRAAEELTASEDVPKWEGAEIMQEGLRSMGFDGITHVGGGRVKADGVSHRVFIAFDPEQIKSTTGNNGEFDGANPDIRFARAIDFKAFGRIQARPASMPVSEVRRIVGELSAAWKDGPTLEVVATPADLPIDAPSDARGLIYKGTAYVVARNHNDKNGIAKTLAHEAIGHYGLWKILGKDGARQFAKNLQLAIKSGNKPLTALSQQIRDMYVDDNGDFNLTPQQEADEIAAFAVENAIDPVTGEFKPGFGFFKQVWAKVAEFLRDLGISVKFTNVELQGLLVSSMRGLEAGKRLNGGWESLVAAGRSPTKGNPDGANAGRATSAPTSTTASLTRDGRVVGLGEIVPQNKSDSNPDIALARGIPTPNPGLFQPTVWNTPESTKTDRVIYELQDGRVDLKRVQQAIEKSGQAIVEKWDARLAETLYPGRVAYRSKSFLDSEVKPLLDAMARNNLGMDELADFLHARGSGERNKQIAKVNPAMPDGGSGTNTKGVLMTTQAAKDHIDAIRPARMMLLVAMARRVDAITGGTRRLLVTEGLEKQETIDAWEGAYKNYVPMFRDEAESGAPHPQGSGFTVKGSSSKRATGSTKEVTNILAHVLMQREAAITRAEKNRVALALYGQALTHPNPDFWTTIKPGMKAAQIGAELAAMGVDPMTAQIGMEGVPTIRTVDPISGKVIDRPNPMYKNLPGAITLKVNGEDRVLMLNTKNERGARLAESLKNLDGLTYIDWSVGLLHKLVWSKIPARIAVGPATRWLASVNTAYNPAFGLANLTRDTLGGVINIGSTELRGNALKVLAQTPVAILGIARELASGGQGGKWQALYRQFQADGGQTGYKENFRDAGDRAKAIETELSHLSKLGKLSPGRAAHAMLNLLEGFNTTLENAVRLSAYSAGLDKGMSRAKAARLGRELTVDFNRKGRMGRELGPLYAFFNASVQGISRGVETLKGPTGAKVIAGGLGLGVLQALMLLAAGYDDDEIPEFVKTRSLIIPLFGKEKHFIAIPYPLELQMVPNTGRVLTELTLNGGKDISKRMFEAIGTIAGSFNPLGGGNIFTADGALKTMMPTLIDPLIELGFNKNFAGGNIEKQGYGSETDNRPGIARAKESTQRSTTGQAYMGISKAINSLMGGDDYQAGVLSPTPERLRYIAQTVGGGVLREIEKSINASTAASRGEKVKPSSIPVVGRFYGEVDDDQVQMSRYYDTSKKLHKLESSLKAMEKAGDFEAADKFEAKNPDVEMIRILNKTQQLISKLNREAVQTIGNPAEMALIDKDRVDLMRDLNQDMADLEKMSGKVTLADRIKPAPKPVLQAVE